MGRQYADATDCLAGFIAGHDFVLVGPGIYINASQIPSTTHVIIQLNRLTISFDKSLPLSVAVRNEHGQSVPFADNAANS